MFKSTLVPSVIETSDRGVERAYDIFSRLLKERIVFLQGDIDHQMAGLICAQLIHLEAEDSTKPIQLYINSGGGSIYDGLAIIDIMNFIHCPVYTIANGMAASMASLILACGKKRYATLHCRIMIHQPLGAYEGYLQATDMEIRSKELNFLKELTAEIYAAQTGKALKYIKHRMERDHFMSSAESKAFGLIDEVLNNRLSIN